MSKIGFVFPLAVILFCRPAVATIVIGHTDDFEDGTTESWTDGGRPASSVTYTNIANGGPVGSGDNYLEVAHTGGNIAALNDSTNWTGDYQTAGVTTIQLDMKAFTTDLDIRLVIFDGFNNSAERWTSANSMSLPNDGDWHTLTFSFLESDLTQVAGTGTYGDVITNVNRIMFRHQSGLPTSGGTSIAAATFGIDNVTATAVPEPSAFALIGVVGLAWGAVSRRWWLPISFLRWRKATH